MSCPRSPSHHPIRGRSVSWGHTIFGVPPGSHRVTGGPGSGTGHGPGLLVLSPRPGRLRHARCVKNAGGALRLDQGHQILGKPWENHRKTIGKPWENSLKHRKAMGKPSENHGKTMGKPWENHGKTIGKLWENIGTLWANIGKPWENYGKTMEKPVENYRKLMERP